MVTDMIATPPESSLDQRRRAEKLLKTSESVTPEMHSPEEIKLLLHELRVHQIELEMQNEELRRSQNEIDASQARYFDLYDLAPVGYLTLCEKRLIREVNLAAANMFNVARSSLVREPINRVLPKEEQYIFYQHLSQCMESGVQQEWEMRLLRANGELFWALLQVTPRQNGEYWVTLSDITGRKCTEETLLKCQRQYQLIVDKALDGFWIADLQANFIDVNESYCRIIGYTRAELLTMSIHDVEALENDAEINDRIQVLLKTGFHRFETRHRCKNGNIIDVEICVNYFGDEKTFFAFMRDITARKQTEERLVKSQSELEVRVQERTAELVSANERNKQISFELLWAEERERERIAGELHDQVGQNLILVKMKIDELSSQLSSEANLSLAYKTSALLNNSINDIRTLTFKIRPPILDSSGIETALEWLCSSLRKDYALQVNFSTDGLPKPLSADARYSLYQAVRELLLNVVKHAGTGTAQLLIRSENNTVIVQVIDEGVGFIHSTVNQSHAVKASYGLYNVQNRIELMGGRCVVESARGYGTTVTITVLQAEN